MKTTILPITRLGKWSVRLFVTFIALSIVGGMISSLKGNTSEYPNPFNSPLLGTTIYLMFIAVMIASVTGLIAVSKHNERSILVYISIYVGIMLFIGVLMLLIGNII